MWMEMEKGFLRNHAALWRSKVAFDRFAFCIWKNAAAVGHHRVV